MIRALLFLHLGLQSLALADLQLQCENLKVNVVADKLKIPWSKKEYYIQIDEDPTGTIICSFFATSADDARGNFSYTPSNLRVEWLFYPEYVNLKKLEEDFKLMHEEGKPSQLLEQPCKFPIQNQG